MKVWERVRTGENYGYYGMKEAVFEDGDSWPWLVGADAPFAHVSFRCEGEVEWFGLSDLYFCETCSRVLSAHPRDVVDEIDAYYCPQSLDNLPSSEAMVNMQRSVRQFQCPVCEAIVVQKSRDGSFIFVCGYCRWTSDYAGLTGNSGPNLAEKALEMEKKSHETEQTLISELIKHFSQKEMDLLPATPSPQKETRKSVKERMEDAERELQAPLWKWEDADEAFESRTKKALTEPTVLQVPGEIQQLQEKLAEPLKRDAALPFRLKLRTKRSVRCRQCFNENQPSILVKTQINPLKGDSSMRTNVGAWFKKKSLAMDFLPRLSVRKPQGDGFLLIVTNPTDFPMEIRIDSEEWIFLAAYDEVEAIDHLFNPTANPKWNPPVSNASHLVRGSFLNKVLLTLPTEANTPHKLTWRQKHLEAGPSNLKAEKPLNSSLRIDFRISIGER